MGQILSHEGRLFRTAGHLLPADSANCCCNTGREKAYLFAECCDGDPKIWIAASAFLPALRPCPVVRFGTDQAGKPLCFRNTGQEGDAEQLIAGGVSVLRSFNTAVGDGCTNNAQCLQAQVAGECRECPAQCCLKGYPPVCRPGIDPRTCCVLGSAARVVKTYQRTERIFGCLFALQVTNQGMSWTAGLSVDPIYEQDWTVREEGLMVRQPPPGFFCSGLQPQCSTRTSLRERRWVMDGWRWSDTDDLGLPTLQAQIVPINGRVETVVDTVTIDDQCRISDPYPTVIVGSKYDPEADRYIESACNLSDAKLVCGGGVPCPAPGNPWYYSEAWSLRGSFGCLYGSQFYSYESVTKSSPNDLPAGYQNPHSSGENAQYRRIDIRITYEITPVSRVGCEVRDCADVPPDTGGVPGPQPVMGGCAGCRQGPGL